MKEVIDEFRVISKEYQNLNGYTDELLLKINEIDERIKYRVVIK